MADVQAQCAALGLDAAQLQQPRQHEEHQDTFELWPEHWDAWEVFLGCATQWRVVAGLGGAYYQGLDYGAVQAVMARYGVTGRRRAQLVFVQLQLLEDEAVRALNAITASQREQ